MDSWVQSAQKSILKGILFLKRLHDFSLLSSNSFIYPFFISKFTRKNSLTPKKFHFWRPIFVKQQIFMLSTSQLPSSECWSVVSNLHCRARRCGSVPTIAIFFSLSNIVWPKRKNLFEKRLFQGQLTDFCHTYRFNYQK